MGELIRKLLEDASRQNEETPEFSAWSNEMIAAFPVRPYDTLRSFTVERFDYPEGRGYDFRLVSRKPVIAETESLAQHAWHGTGGSRASGRGLVCAVIASVEYVRAQMHSVLWIGARLNVYRRYAPESAARFVEEVLAINWHDAEAVLGANFQPFSCIGARESSADNLYNWGMTINTPEFMISDLEKRFPGVNLDPPTVEELMSAAAVLALDAALASDDAAQALGLVSLAANAMWQAGYQGGWESHGDMLRDGAKSAGKRGGELRHKGSRALKDWALREAASLRGSEMDIARKLVQRIPQEHRQSSANPERLIYEALRNARKGTARE